MMEDKISTTVVAKNRQNRAYRGFWLVEQNRQPPFFTTHPESILTSDRKKCDFRDGLTTPASRIRLSQERLSAQKCCRLDDLEGRRSRFESLDLDFEGCGPSNRTILGKSQPPFFTPREKLTSNSTIFEALARLEIRLRDLGGREKADYVFWVYVYCFLGTLMPSEGIKGQVVSRRG